MMKFKPKAVKPKKIKQIEKNIFIKDSKPISSEEFIMQPKKKQTKKIVLKGGRKNKSRRKQEVNSVKVN